ncbi:hypothetical protein QYE76_068158 [Lolium multiflorum]|uniref:CCHC-type domain-containing protein n=1 Tax=Lolium multiflorum TaxID=4521 RepID=A0AAD8SFQ6_LOLMU|nr:hypothetical protein QYE76_068158 [Lolium multiflorum]
MPWAPPSSAPTPSSRPAPFPTSSSKSVSNVSNTKKPEPAASTSGSSMSIVRNHDMNCHTCGGKGHFKRDCPNRKVMIINDHDEYEPGDDVDPYAPEDDDYDSDGVDAFLSEAHTIVVSQRALNVQLSASTQRCNLFQTKTLVDPDKACKVIIDGGSFRSLASKELCAKLKLKYLPHPHPYYIQWLSDNGEMKVNHMVRVDFAIGPYKDSIDFDVVPMTEFSDVFPEEVPAGLPPLRGIEHQIDLIPGVSLPNRAPYRTNPEETKVHFLKDRFPKLRKSKLLPRGASPCKVLPKINDNAYAIDLPTDEFGVSNSFNVADLTPYEREDLGASRSTPFEGGGGDDEDIPTELLPPSLQDEDNAAVKLKSNEPKSFYLCMIRYEEGASITRGEEEQLDVKLDMELDMKTFHGRTREEREACARKEDQVQVGAQPGQTGRHAGRPSATLGPTGFHAGTARRPPDPAAVKEHFPPFWVLCV